MFSAQNKLMLQAQDSPPRIVATRCCRAGQLTVSARAGWLPVAGWGGFRHLILPAITLALPYAAYIARLARNGTLDVMQQDFIRTARAKGLPESMVVLRHALPNALARHGTDVRLLLPGYPQLIAAADEERFSRKKHDFGFPQVAVGLGESALTLHHASARTVTKLFN